MRRFTIFALVAIVAISCRQDFNSAYLMCLQSVVARM